MSSVPPPAQDAIANLRRRGQFSEDQSDPLENLVGFKWLEWFGQIGGQINNSSQRVGGTALTSQTASLPATDLSAGGASAGLYRLTWYARVTTPASVSSSLTITIGWTDTAVSCSFSGAAMTGNTTTTVQSETFMLYSDGNSPITIATTYASVGTPMQYKLSAVLEAVQL